MHREKVEKRRNTCKTPDSVIEGKEKNKKNPISETLTEERRNRYLYAERRSERKKKKKKKKKGGETYLRYRAESEAWVLSKKP